MIRIFLYKSFLFIAICVILIISLFFLVLKGIDLEADFKLDHNVEYVIMGHSHAEYAYNDKIINTFKNVAQAGEAYIYTYIKLRKLINQNKNLKAVFIEFSNNQIDPEMDNWMREEEFLNEKLPLYLPFMDKEEIEDLYTGNIIGFKNTLSKAFRYNLIYLFTAQFKYLKKIGGFRTLERVLSDSDIEKQKDINKTFKESINKLNNYKISKKNLEYLQKSITLCKEKNIPVYLIRTPTNNLYEYLNNEQIFNKIIYTRFVSIDFLDFKDFPLENKDFADVSHLNNKGAKKLSSFINDLIKGGLLKRVRKQDLINKKMIALSPSHKIVPATIRGFRHTNNPPKRITYAQEAIYRASDN